MLSHSLSLFFVTPCSSSGVGVAESATFRAPPAIKLDGFNELLHSGACAEVFTRYKNSATVKDYDVPHELFCLSKHSNYVN